MTRLSAAGGAPSAGLGTSSAATPASAEVSARDVRVAVVAARFNDVIVAGLLSGALVAWEKAGGRDSDLTILRVPGAFELPVAAKRLAESRRYDAVIAFGCVIRGETAHFEYVAGPTADGLMRAALDTGVPVIFGVLTVETEAQARERVDVSRLNKGGEAMEAAIEMAHLLRKV
jgi:6,7-dimethyl-8-ribityllumazine synthase